MYARTAQVGFARVISDKATSSRLADVLIREPPRGNGLSKRLMQSAVGHPELQGPRRFRLGTPDARGLYQRSGFTSLAHPAHLMEILRPSVYQDS